MWVMLVNCSILKSVKQSLVLVFFYNSNQNSV